MHDEILEVELPDFISVPLLKCSATILHYMRMRYMSLSRYGTLCMSLDSCTCQDDRLSHCRLSHGKPSMLPLLVQNPAAWRYLLFVPLWELAFAAVKLMPTGAPPDNPVTRL